jgi:hypothetical protein
MLARDDAFLEIMKIVLLTFSLFSEIQDNCSLQESFFFSLQTSKTNTRWILHVHCDDFFRAVYLK